VQPFQVAALTIFCYFVLLLLLLLFTAGKRITRSKRVVLAVSVRASAMLLYLILQKYTNTH
jgi:predicted membrane-bound dolichyl-phosphate-mannose-protein mannosyltransferase